MEPELEIEGEFDFIAADPTNGDIGLVGGRQVTRFNKKGRWLWDHRLGDTVGRPIFRGHDLVLCAGWDLVSLDRRGKQTWKTHIGEDIYHVYPWAHGTVAATDIGLHLVNNLGKLTTLPMGIVTRLATHADGEALAAFAGRKHLHVITSDGKGLVTLAKDNLKALSVSREPFFAIGGDDRGISCWNNQGKLVFFEGTTEPVTATGITSGGSQRLAGCSNGQVIGMNKRLDMVWTDQAGDQVEKITYMNPGWIVQTKKKVIIYDRGGHKRFKVTHPGIKDVAVWQDLVLVLDKEGVKGYQGPVITVEVEQVTVEPENTEVKQHAKRSKRAAALAAEFEARRKALLEAGGEARIYRPAVPGEDGDSD